MERFTLCIIILVYWAYIILGTVTFHFLEKDYIPPLPPTHLAKVMAGLVNQTTLDKTELSRLVNLTLTLYTQAVGNASRAALNWDYSNCYFFALTVVTTIGYGTQTPQTAHGKLFCCFYAVIGIPLCLLVLAGIGERINYFNRRISEHITQDCTRAGKNAVRMILLMLLGTLVSVFVPTAAFHFIEDWSYGTSLYFVVVTLSTVGFGDFVVSNNLSAWYRVLTGLWIFYGLAWFSSLISSIQDIVQSAVVPLQLRRTSYKKTKERERQAKEMLAKEDDTQNCCCTRRTYRHDNAHQNRTQTLRIQDNPLENQDKPLGNGDKPHENQQDRPRRNQDKPRRSRERSSRNRNKSHQNQNKSCEVEDTSPAHQLHDRSHQRRETLYPGTEV